MDRTRRASRHASSLTANLHVARGEAGTVVHVRDISTLGCQVEHAKGPKLGKKCELYFDWQGSWVGLEAKVVWMDDRGRVGLRYEKIDEHSRRCLQELCASLQSQSLAGRRAGDRNAAGAMPKSPEKLGTEHPMFRPVAPPPARADSEQSRRTLPRYISELRGDVRDSATGKSADVSLVDLSVSGARLEGNVLPDAGQTCQLHTEWEGRDLVLRGEVAWKTRKQIGMKFSSLDDETMRQLRRICASLHLAPPGPPI
ncbi:MAG: PilZ domain-containing protein [Deltaproteobacteria bacterium]